MRVLEANYGDVRIFSDRPFGYKRYHVEWSDGTLETFTRVSKDCCTSDCFNFTNNYFREDNLI